MIIMWEYILPYTAILLFFCLENLLHYKYINQIRPNLNEKQKSFILSIKSSLSMFLIGIYFNYHYFTSKLNEEHFFNVLEEKGSLNLGKVMVLYFTAHLIMDTYIGHKEYKQSMKALSGYFHHAVYTVINILSLYIGVFPLYLLHMLSEIPTFLLGIGSFDSRLRNDNLFGTTFFLTRIVYHIILTWMFRKHTLLLSLSLAALCLHIYWFSGWFKKYFAPKSKNQEKIPKTKKAKKHSKNVSEKSSKESQTPKGVTERIKIKKINKVK